MKAVCVLALCAATAVASTTNSYVSQATGRWFAGPTSWSAKRFPSWPDTARVPSTSQVSIEQVAPGAALNVLIEGQLVVTNALELAPSTCDATQRTTAEAHCNDGACVDTQCDDIVKCADYETEMTPRTATVHRTCAPKTCVCPVGGVAAVSNSLAPNHCHEHGATKCESCTHEHRHLDPNTHECIVNTCRCSHGQVATDTACTEYVGPGVVPEICVAGTCNTGFHAENHLVNGNTHMRCVANDCSCGNGAAKTGADCTAHQTEMCASCNAGFHLEGDACVANVCSCNNGTAKTGTACTAHQTEMCDACKPGFHHEGHACKANECVCTDGTPQESGTAACTEHGAHLCDTCKAGFRRTADTCTVNVCTCADGVPQTGAQCDQHDANICASCHVGHHPEGDHCHDNECSCNYGTAVDTGSAACSTHREEICASCDDGYHKTGLTCSPNTCKCDNGTPMDSGTASCSANGSHLCKSCDDGYHLAGSKCLPNQCTCSNGTPQPTGKPACHSDDAHLCAVCNLHYTPVGDLCQDVTQPAIFVQGEAKLTLEAHPSGSYVDQGAVCYDQVDGEVPVASSKPSDSSWPKLSVPGEYDVTYNCTDAADNKQTATRVVVVHDTTPPTVALNGEATTLYTVDTQNPQQYTDAGATCRDTLDGELSSRIKQTSDVDITAEGDYTVTYACTDNSGNTANKMRVVRIVFKPIDGGWSDWSAWGPCSGSLPSSTRGRSRTCDNPPPQHRGADCIGSPTNSQECQNGQWSAWSQCTEVCNGGTQARTCTNPPPFRGDDCSALDGGNSDRACNQVTCEASIECPHLTCTHDGGMIQVKHDHRAHEAGHRYHHCMWHPGTKDSPQGACKCFCNPSHEVQARGTNQHSKIVQARQRHQFMVYGSEKL